MKPSTFPIKAIASAGLLFGLAGVLLLLARSSYFAEHPEQLSAGITLDLVFTVPLIYFFIIRKTSIPKLTVVPVFVVGLVLAGAILPEDQLFVLEKVKLWVLPLVELTVVGVVIWKITQLSKAYKKNNLVKPHFYDALLEAARSTLPNKLVLPFATEVSMVYYSLLAWRRPQYNENNYTYHKRSGTAALFGVLIFVVVAETFTLHLLLVDNWPLLAWILSGLSIYTGLQLLGIARSMKRIPHQVNEDSLHLRMGIFSRAKIPFHAIESVELNRKPQNWDKLTRKMALVNDLEHHNTIITVKSPQTLFGLYGLKRTYTTLAFFVDEKEDFIQLIEEKIAQQNTEACTKRNSTPFVTQ